MTYEVVARRWRPLTFDAVVGQQHVTRTLINAIERDRVAHAFLFTGIRGVGKTTVARLLARALNCEQRRGAEPCNECPSCRQILAGSSVDVIEIDAASNRGIDEVRSLIETAQYRPAGGRFRVYIIDEVHQLTREAFNALLKILEEPPGHVKFVLATTEVQKVPPTVLSRCQRHDFRTLTATEIREQLERIVEGDGLGISREVVSMIAREAGGSMRDAESLLEQIVVATGGDLDAETAAELLGIAREQMIVECVEAVLCRRPEVIVDLIDKLRTGSADPHRFVAGVLDVLRHVAVAAAAGADGLGDASSETVREAALRLKDERSPLDVQRIFDSLLSTAGAMRGSAADPDLVLEMGLLKAAAFEDVVSAAEILARLDGASAGSGGAASPPRERSSKKVQRPRGRDVHSTQGSAGGLGGDAADAAVAEPSESSGAGQWERFLDFVRSRGELDLYVTLANCEVRDPEGDQWVLRPIVAGFRSKFGDSAALKRLAELASECTGRRIEVRLDDGNGDGTGISAHAIERGHKARVERAALSDPVVQAALTVLGGKVGKIARLDD
ncbi:MAG: DNA polymerase III subunit gamma/tau [Deltaproteobacteria bacterium]|nr:MAG: DNA polymerase III subunit gamma/tau [Deltaproteobacteria bacterium]